MSDNFFDLPSGICEKCGRVHHTYIENIETLKRELLPVCHKCVVFGKLLFERDLFDNVKKDE